MRPLIVVGNVNVDLILGPTPPWPQPGTEVLVAGQDLRPGGSAGNTALAWAGLGLEHQVIANIGDDHYGPWLRAAFGPAADHWPVTPGPTTLSVGLTHPDGERTFFTTPGHLPAFCFDHVQTALAGREAAISGGLLLLCGSFLTPGLTADDPALLAWAKDRGLSIALDTGWPLDGWTPAVIAAVRGWLPACDHLLFNAAEAQALTGGAEPAAAARRLADALAPGAVAVVKCGPAGALATVAGTTEIITCPGQPVTVVDTVGAGDVFNAGYLAAVAAGQPLAAALHAGVAVASLAISTSPRRYPAFSSVVSMDRSQ